MTFGNERAAALKVAVAKYTIDAPADFDAFARKQAQWLDEAKALGARIAVLPEYLSLELAAVFPPVVHADLQASLAAIQSASAASSLVSTSARRFISVVIV